MKLSIIRYAFLSFSITSPISISLFFPEKLLIPRILLLINTLLLIFTASERKAKFTQYHILALLLLGLCLINLLYSSPSQYQAFLELGVPFVVFILAYLISLSLPAIIHFKIRDLYRITNLWLIGTFFFNLSTILSLLLFRIRLFVPTESIIDGIRYNHGFRLSEPTQSPTFLSALGGILVIYSIHRLRSSNKPLREAWVWLVSLMLSLLVLLSSFSRTGLYALILTYPLSSLLATLSSCKFRLSLRVHKKI